MQRELLGGVLLLRGFWSPVLRGHEDTGQGQQESPLLCCKATEKCPFHPLFDDTFTERVTGRKYHSGRNDILSRLARAATMTAVFIWMVVLCVQWSIVHGASCKSPLIVAQTGPDAACNGGNMHYWPTNYSADQCHGWEARDWAWRRHKNSANNMRCTGNGTFSFVQYPETLDCSGEGTVKTISMQCKQDIPPVLHTKGIDLNCCDHPEACIVDNPEVSVQGSYIYLNGEPCDGQKNSGSKRDEPSGRPCQGTWFALDLTVAGVQATAAAIIVLVLGLLGAALYGYKHGWNNVVWKVRNPMGEAPIAGLPRWQPKANPFDSRSNPLTPDAAACVVLSAYETLLHLLIRCLCWKVCHRVADRQGWAAVDAGGDARNDQGRRQGK
eukprot:3658659-Rhodomonas_salina.2